VNENNDRIPQKIHHLLMEIGEKSVLFRLFLLTKQYTDCKVFQNLSGVGYDILFLKGRKEIKIEVKTRQRLYTTAKGSHSNIVHFTLTKSEYDNCDFVIAYWYEKNYYFIIPKEDLKETSSKGTPIYKFIVRQKTNGELDNNSLKYLDKWDKIILD
jgi:hypothetical protein